jgi:hypothetical protein
MTPPEFVEFPKIPRLSREIIVTEKIDGTCGVICITEDGGFFVGSRSRWITPQDDNHGFAKWAYEHKNELLALGPGRHFGEWAGLGIQRGYGLHEKRWYLFNATRWAVPGESLLPIPQQDPRVTKVQQYPPACCHVVPVLYRGVFDTSHVTDALSQLRDYGSVAAPGFMKPEGIVVFHILGNVGFKKTLERDEEPKSRGNK